MHKRTATATATAALLATLVLGACGDDDDSTTQAAAPSPTTVAAAAPEPAPAEPADAAAAPVITVDAIDFAFLGIKEEEVPVGTRFELTNSSTKELHELVAIRLPDSETRSAEELLALPPEQQAALLRSGPPATVILAPPGGEQIDAVGDGTLTEPGRYLLLCAIPTGADPAAYLAAAAGSEGPPQVEGGPPHLVHGMWDEVVVVDA